MIRKALAVMSALAVSACLLAPSTAVSATHEQVFVRKFTCVTGTPRKGSVVAPSKVATMTKVGNAEITAAHVVRGCLDGPEAVVFEDIDFAVVNPGKINSCRAPLDWTTELLEQAKATLSRIYGALRRVWEAEGEDATAQGVSGLGGKDRMISSLSGSWSTTDSNSSTDDFEYRVILTN
jgi:hypothetical protein